MPRHARRQTDGPEGQLGRYREMRHFEDTPEPSGETGPSGPPDGLPRFVVQEHHATALHWDFRLERDGVLVSWAVPKGIPPDPATNHLAVHTEDHPMEYLTFAGDIPEGNYGAGGVSIWDTGTYEEEKWGPREVIVVLHGARVEGRYVLFQTGGRNWMIHRMDPPSDPNREPPPVGAAPMWASPDGLPRGNPEGWAADVAWEGARALLAVQGGRPLALHWATPDAAPEDVTDRFPELRAVGEALSTTEILADIELVVPGDGGRPDPDALARRLSSRGAAARRMATASPAAAMVSDVLWLDGANLLDTPAEVRRKRLAAVAVRHPAWQAQPWRAGQAKALLEAARTQGLAGVVVKRVDSAYHPGQVSRDWRLVSAR